MRLYELAYGCRIYGELTGFDRSIQKFRRSVHPQLDPYDDGHAQALFDWLNDWGCRQFSVAHHMTVASPSLRRWSDIWMAKLPDADVQIDQLTALDLDGIAAAYGDLVGAAAGYRDHKTGALSEVKYGATGASKALHGLRPLLFPPWDRPFRNTQRYGEGTSAYRSYLSRVINDLESVAAEGRVSVSDIPDAIDRPDSSPVKLIDEYYWATITRRVVPPQPEILQRWVTWASTGG
jgi:hypothetical protein